MAVDAGRNTTSRRDHQKLVASVTKIDIKHSEAPKEINDAVRAEARLPLFRQLPATDQQTQSERLVKGNVLFKLRKMADCCTLSTGLPTTNSLRRVINRRQLADQSGSE